MSVTNTSSTLANVNNPFTVIIPARMGSSRIANKMLLNLGDLPLIIHTAKQALKSDAANVVVATDHSAIADTCTKHGINSVMTQTTHTSGTDRLAEAATLLKLNSTDIVINVQGDEPLIDPILINQLATFMHLQRTAIATIAHAITQEEEIFNPHIVKVVLDANKHALYFSRAPIPYYRDGFTLRTHFKLPTTINVLRHIGIYAYSVGFLQQYTAMTPCPLEQVEQLEQLRALYYGHKIAVLVSDIVPEIGVDTLEDLQRIRQLLISQGIYAN